MIHCWESYGAWLEKNDPVKYQERVADLYREWPTELEAMCMLEDGHEGPHEWVPAQNITVTFVDA